MREKPQIIRCSGVDNIFGPTEKTKAGAYAASFDLSIYPKQNGTIIRTSFPGQWRKKLANIQTAFVLIKRII